MNWYLDAFRKYAQFNGRAPKPAYWYFVLFNIVFSVVAGILDGVLGTYSMSGTGILGALYGIATIILGISVGVRRLHDTGRSGWLLLLALVPIVGWIFLLIWTVQDSEPGANVYGPHPGGSAPAAAA